MCLLANKVVLITGGSRGIGRHLVERYVGHGANVFMSYRSCHEGANAVCDAVRDTYGHLEVFSGDVSDEHIAKEMVNSCIDHFGKINIAINCAGVLGKIQKVASIDAQHTADVLSNNFFTALHVTRFAIPHLRATAGSVIYISSPSAATIKPGNLSYSLSKVAVERLAMTVAEEEIECGIRSNIIIPSSVDTDMYREHVSGGGRPSIKFADCNEIFDVCNFLCSDISTLTGHRIYIGNSPSY